VTNIVVNEYQCDEEKVRRSVIVVQEQQQQQVCKNANTKRVDGNYNTRDICSTRAAEHTGIQKQIRLFISPSEITYFGMGRPKHSILPAGISNDG